MADASVLAEIHGRMGLITLNRPQALNALTLNMVRRLTAILLEWMENPQVLGVAIRGQGREGPFGVFCAGGDIRFFHQAALQGDPSLDDFFTEEYALNHLIHTYPKPYIAFMDGVVMGGGMGISQGASLRIVTDRTRMAMPETAIGLFPDVGGGYFLSRCPGRTGEYLALTGEAIGARDAMRAHLADGYLPAAQLTSVWDTLAQTPFETGEAIEHWVATRLVAPNDHITMGIDRIDNIFAAATVGGILQALERDASEWAENTVATLRKRSPLMLHVVLEQVRRARHMGLADDLRMERDLVRHCFNTAHLGRPGPDTETVEGVRALAIDKDHNPRWNPERIEDVTAEMVMPFFESPWPAHAHPLRQLR